MARINDFELGIAIKIAAKRCLDAEVSEFMALNTENTTVAPRVEKRVSRKLRSDEWKPLRHVSALTLKYAVIALVCTVSVFFAFSMTVTPVRAAFFGAIITWYEEYIDVRYESDGNENTNEEMIVKKPTYIPDGWSIIEENTSEFVYYCTLTNSSDGSVNYTQNTNYEDGFWIDNDAHEEEIVYLKNDTVEANLFIYEDGRLVLFWKDEYLFSFVAFNTELEDLIMIAEGIN